ncbi:UDP-glucose:solanidine glucosyltransferase [Naegleria gruberi]|uniref:UDP-glucose:solanidine glucosyltransferase n=1 Tax=Naegleria gruberi TaxID=5762 RepID=D2VZU1_NAEGR|nr:UDP-glucose:solanidine glucosyltransferase [Naegleria gruberi]EFC37629.1 UDP-glucose:solanidine glucosyltransferase [Naegleria gruberi]|eukprot:XP_002670373.1 UDP-glucose:solanidine glucosyltransferase [Naegleria gruberi strain NEG-M]
MFHRHKSGIYLPLLALLAFSLVLIFVHIHAKEFDVKNLARTTTEQDCTRKQFVFIPTPDSSHVRDMSDVAKATSLILNAKCKGFNISQVKVLTVFIWKSVLEEIANNSMSEYFPHEQYFTPTLMYDIKDSKVKAKLKEMDGFRKSETSKMKRYVMGIDILSVAYSTIIQTIDNMFEQDSEMRSIKEERPEDILFVIDMTAHSAVDYVQREGFNFVIVNIMPSVIFNHHTPQYIGRFPFTTTSLAKLERIYREEGIFKYLLTRLYEEVYIQGQIILQGIKSIQELNSDRRANNMTEKNEILFTTSEKTFIHFTAPGVLDYSYAISHNNRFVGYKAKSKKDHKLVGKPKLFDNLGESNFTMFNEKNDNLMDDEMVAWLDDQLERKFSIVYVAFGTKLEISHEHITTILNFIVKSDENIRVICVHEGHAKLNLSESVSSKILFQTWVNQELILSHSATSVFVTHAGAHSLFEAVDNQVPILTFPIFADQFSNSVRSEDLGFGFDISEDIYNRDEKSFVKSMKTVLRDRMEIKKRMREIMRINQNAAKLSISTIQSFGESFKNVTEIVSNNVLTAGEIIIDVAFDHLDEHLRDVSTKLSWYIQLNIPLIFVSSIALSLLFLTFRCCFGRIKIENMKKK